MEFAKVHYKQGTETKSGFVQKTMASEVKQGEYLCTSHGMQWRWWIRGGTWSNCFHQPLLALKRTGNMLYSREAKGTRRIIWILIRTQQTFICETQAESNNLYDRNAIAVYIMASSEYKKVGYLAHELTQYLHPLLKDPSLEVSVNKIRFCTTFLMIEFYLTINITRKGLWEKAFFKASFKVK